MSPHRCICSHYLPHWFTLFTLTLFRMQWMLIDLKAYHVKIFFIMWISNISAVWMVAEEKCIFQIIKKNMLLFFFCLCHLPASKRGKKIFFPMSALYLLQHACFCVARLMRKFSDAWWFIEYASNDLVSLLIFLAIATMHLYLNIS